MSRRSLTGSAAVHLGTFAKGSPLVGIAFEAGTLEQDLTNSLHCTTLKFDAGLSANINAGFRQNGFARRGERAVTVGEYRPVSAKPQEQLHLLNAGEVVEMLDVWHYAACGR